MVKHILLIITSIALCGCNNHFQFKGFIVPTGDTVNQRFEQSAEMYKDLKYGTIEAQENYMFYVLFHASTYKAGIDAHLYTTNFELYVLE